MRSVVLRRLLAWLAVSAAVMAVPLLTDSRFVLKVLAKDVGVNVLVVVGLALLFGYAGQVSLGHAAFLGIGAYTSAYVTMQWGLPWVAGIVAAALLSALGGALLALPSLRLKGHYLAMATLGFGQIAYIFFREADSITGGFDGLGGIPSPKIGGFEFVSPESGYWLVWGVVLLSLLLAYNVVALRPGRAMRALHGSELGARACGVDTVGVKLQAFIVSAALAGVAGSLYAHLVRFISPELFTLHRSVLLVAMAVLGGTSSLAGPVLAAVGLTMLHYVDAFIPWVPQSVSQVLQNWETDIYGLAIIVVMLFAPRGIGGLLRRLGRWRARADGAGEAEAA